LSSSSLGLLQAVLPSGSPQQSAAMPSERR
jgi:hypothetical protein